MYTHTRIYTSYVYTRAHTHAYIYIYKHIDTYIYMYLAINFKVHRWIFIRKGCDVKKESLIVAQHAADYV